MKKLLAGAVVLAVLTTSGGAVYAAGTENEPAAEMLAEEEDEDLVDDVFGSGEGEEGSGEGQEEENQSEQGGEEGEPEEEVTEAPTPEVTEAPAEEEPGAENGQEEADVTAPETDPAENEPAEAEPTETPEPTPEPTEAPTEAPTAAPTETPTPAPTETPVPVPTEAVMITPALAGEKVPSYKVTVNYDSEGTLVPTPDPALYAFIKADEAEPAAEEGADPVFETHFAKLTYNEAGKLSIGELKNVTEGAYTLKLFTASDKAKGDAAATDSYDPTSDAGKDIFTELKVGEVFGGIYKLKNLTSSITVGSSNTSVTIDAEVQAKGGAVPGIIKKITGTAKTSKTFDFALYETKNDFKTTDLKPISTKSTSGTITKDGGARVLFDRVIFTKAGTYYFSVKETSTKDGGFTPDSSENHITYKVEEKNGTFEVTEISVQKAGTSAGTYQISQASTGSGSPTPSVITVAVSKLTSAEKDSSYCFYGPVAKEADLLNTKTGVLSAKAGETKKVSKESDGTYSASLKGTISKKGTYYAAVAKEGEIIPEAVFVIEAAENAGKLVSTWSVAGAPAVFTNTYKPTPIKDQTISVTKKVTGSPDKEETFSFLMKRKSGKTASTLKITGSGKANFPKKLTFTSPGTFTYIITEEKGKATGYTYDTSEYRVVYSVTDDGEGKLSYTKTITKDGKDASDVVFTNKYKSPEDEIVYGDFSFTKTDSDTGEGVSGASYTLYKIKAKRGTNDYTKAAKYLKKGTVYNQQLKKAKTEVSDGEGSVSFLNLQSDTYYVIRETKAAAGFQKSANPIVISTKKKNGEFTATVIDNGDNTAETDDNGEITWADHPTKVVIRMLSSSGAYLKNAKLTLTDANGKRVTSWQSGATGYEVKYLEAGKKYTVTQTNLLAGYTKASPVTFTVEAKDVTTSDYVQTVSVTSKKNSTTVKRSTTTKKTTTSIPTSSSRKANGASTGDNSPIMLLIGAMIAAAAAVFFVLRKRKQ